MRDKSNNSFFHTIKLLSETFFTLTTNLKTLFLLESKLACKSLGKLLFLFVVLSFLLVSSWLSFLGVIVALLLYFKINLLLIFTILFIIHLLCLGLIYYKMKKAKNNLGFKGTRKQLAHLISNS